MLLLFEGMRLCAHDSVSVVNALVCLLILCILPSSACMHMFRSQKDQHLVQGEDESHRYNQQCEKNKVVLGRAYQPPQRRPMDLACHHLETI